MPHGRHLPYDQEPRGEHEQVQSPDRPSLAALSAEPADFKLQESAQNDQAERL